MDDFRHAVQASLTALGTNTLDLLRSRDLLLSLVRRQIIEKATESLNPPVDLIQKALKEHCQKEQLNNDASLNKWLEDHCLNRDELLHQLSLPFKLSKLALDEFGNQAEAHFLQRKEEIDQVTYSLLRVKNSGMAYELYLQLEANESNFERLATNHSEGPEQRSGGRVVVGSGIASRVVGTAAVERMVAGRYEWRDWGLRPMRCARKRHWEESARGDG